MLFHNYKNSFFIIERLAGQISKSPHLAEKNAEMIKEIAEDSSTAIAKIIESFKNDFAFNPNKFNITECTKKAVNKSNIPEGMTVIQSYASRNDFIHGNEAALCDAIVNVINNAADSVSTNKNEKVIKISVFSEQGLCCIEIEDNGQGIPGKVKKKIFSPFYSTKHGGKNNGIGLTYTKRIVSEHQGKIDLKSIPNQLTSFQLVFPVFKARKSSR
ncbi:MAG: GHKL domain-containing protein, partial [Clostridia bacterium]|nr:GHKL domain-containing protein [Clostridia bacterium]